MQYKLIFIISLSIFFVNCSSSFQPPLYAYQEWGNSNIHWKDRDIIMLKCGYPTPEGEGFNAEPNDIVLMHLCMEKHGFKYKGRFGRYCDQYPTLPACVEAAAAKKAGG